MSLLQSLKSLIGRKPRATAARRGRLTNFFEGFAASTATGGYAGGQRDRITDDWNPGTIGPNRAFMMNGRLLRERAWDLYCNNPFATSAIDAYISNAIECGIVPDHPSNEWEQEWKRWGGMTPHATREADITEDQTLYELMALWLTEVLVGGGCLVHYVDMPRRGRRVPLALELIGEDRFADEVDSFGINPKTARDVVNGHEIDPATGKTVAYHVYKGHPADADLDPYEVIRLPREMCEYAFMKDRIGAKRGTTTLRSVVLWLWALGYYTDNELAASNAKSSWAYIIKTTGGPDWASLNDTNPETGLFDVNNNRIDKHERAQVWRGTAGDEITAVGPNTPPAESLPWLMMIQRSIAIGTRLSYEEVFRDYSKGSFSSVRMARGQDIKRYRRAQAFTIARFGNPTLRRFDLAAVGALLPGLPSPAEYMQERDDLFHQVEWTTPGWESPNPKDDAAADDLNLKNRTITRKEIIGRRGGSSWKSSFAQRELEERDLEARDIAPENPVTGAAAGTDAGGTDNNGDGEDAQP